MKIKLLGLLPLIYVLCVLSCSSGVKDTERDADDESKISQPVMVGGAYLTCSVASIAVEESNVGVGCSVSEADKEHFRSDKVKVILHQDGIKTELSYQSAFDILDPSDRSWNVLDLPKNTVDGSIIEIIYPDGTSSKSPISGGERIASESDCEMFLRFENTFMEAKEDLLKIKELKSFSFEVTSDVIKDNKINAEDIDAMISYLESQRNKLLTNGSSQTSIDSIDKSIEIYKSLKSANVSGFSDDAALNQLQFEEIESEAERRHNLADLVFGQLSERLGATCQ